MSDEPTDVLAVELSRPFRLAKLAEAPEHKIKIEPTPAEREALAARYGLISLDSLKAQLTVRGDVSSEIEVEGHLQAEVVQECVVTLEPVRDNVTAAFEQRYTVRSMDPVADLVIDADNIEPPEPLIGDSIDLGELVAQHLSLSINPYPRGPDADAQADEHRVDTERDGPFAALARLRNQDQS